MDYIKNYFYVYFNAFYSYIKKYSIVGACDNCCKYLYADGIFFEMEELENKSLRLQYCCKDCLDNHKSKYHFLNQFNFKNENDRKENNCIHKKSFLDIIKFIIKYPEVIKFRSVELLEYIINIKNSNNLSNYHEVFLKDVDNYSIC